MGKSAQPIGCKAICGQQRFLTHKEGKLLRKKTALLNSKTELGKARTSLNDKKHKA